MTIYYSVEEDPLTGRLRGFVMEEGPGGKRLLWSGEWMGTDSQAYDAAVDWLTSNGLDGEMR